MLPISRIDRMRGKHNDAPTDALASQDFKHVRKGTGQAVERDLSLRRTGSGRPADYPPRRVGSYSCDQEMRAVRCVVVVLRVRRANEMRVRMQEYRCFPLAAVHVLTGGGLHAGALACDSKIFPARKEGHSALRDVRFLRDIGQYVVTVPP
jgi:hypothetical protein